MPYRVEKETKGVYLKWTGRIIGEEFLKAVHEVNESPDFQMYHYVINDTLGCSGIDLSAMTKEDGIAGAIGAHASNPKFVAAFVADDQTIFDAWSPVAKVADRCFVQQQFLGCPSSWHPMKKAAPAASHHSGFSDLSKVVVEFLILFRFQKVFAFHLLLFLLLSIVAWASCPGIVTAA